MTKALIGLLTLLLLLVMPAPGHAWTLHGMVWAGTKAAAKGAKVAVKAPVSGAIWVVRHL